MLMLTLWALFLVALPIYLWDSGLPQISAAIAAGLVALLAWNRFPLTTGGKRVLLALSLFVAYAVIVNITWVILGTEFSMLQYPLFYIYNLLIVAAALSLYSAFGTRFLTYTVYGIIAAIAFQIILIPFTLDVQSFRQTIVFNNPNQLGYYGLVNVTLLLMIRDAVRLPRLLEPLLLAGAVLLIFLSLSKAAILGLLLLVVLTSSRNLRQLVLVGGLLAVVHVAVAPRFNILDRLNTRLVSLGVQEDDSWARRGYDRIVNHPEYLVFGAGEGDFDRFKSEWGGELHSSWGTLLFSYGVVGVVLFGAFAMRLVSAVPVRTLLLLLPIASYGITHQGLRFTVFWVLLGIVYTTAHKPKHGDKSPRITGVQASGKVVAREASGSDRFDVSTPVVTHLN